MRKTLRLVTMALLIAASLVACKKKKEEVYIDPEAGKPAPKGAVKVGRFHVGNGVFVWFAQGNLKYHPYHNSWQFAENQYDVIGQPNEEVKSNYFGWIDLFGWGTGVNPTETSVSDADYPDFNDWGDNIITNGGNQRGLWRTLSHQEWIYLLHGRKNADNLFGVATIKASPDVKGLVLLPDNWHKPENSHFEPAANHTKRWELWEGNSYYYHIEDTYLYDANTYTLNEWKAMQDSGAVFLPIAGYAIQTNEESPLSYHADKHEYWCSSPADDFGYALICEVRTADEGNEDGAVWYLYLMPKRKKFRLPVRLVR